MSCLDNHWALVVVFVATFRHATSNYGFRRRIDQSKLKKINYGNNESNADHCYLSEKKIYRSFNAICKHITFLMCEGIWCMGKSTREKEKKQTWDANSVFSCCLKWEMKTNWNVIRLDSNMTTICSFRTDCSDISLLFVLLFTFNYGIFFLNRTSTALKVKFVVFLHLKLHKNISLQLLKMNVLRPVFSIKLFRKFMLPQTKFIIRWWKFQWHFNLPPMKRIESTIMKIFKLIFITKRKKNLNSKSKQKIKNKVFNS